MTYEELAYEFMETMGRMRKHKSQKQMNDAMHGEQFVLFYIAKHEGDVIPSDISEEMGTSTARVAAALNGLESKGLITRKIDREDRRRILVNLTESGREQVKERYKSVMGVTVRMMEYLGEDDAKEMVRIMKRIAAKGPENFMGPEDDCPAFSNKSKNKGE